MLYKNFKEFNERIIKISIRNALMSAQIKKFKAIFIDMFETRPVRGSSYIPTPERLANAKCGLINIHNEDHECFKWCVRYHHSPQGKMIVE